MKILIVEDNRLLSDDLSGFFQGNGFFTEVACRLSRVRFFLFVSLSPFTAYGSRQNAYKQGRHEFVVLPEKG